MEGIICTDGFFTWNQNMIKSKWTNLQYKLMSLLLKYLQHQWEKKCLNEGTLEILSISSKLASSSVSVLEKNFISCFSFL